MFINLDLFVCFCQTLKEFFGNRLWTNSDGKFLASTKIYLFQKQTVDSCLFPIYSFEVKLECSHLHPILMFVATDVDDLNYKWF